MELVVATTNVHKIREFREMFKTYPKLKLDILSLIDFPHYTPPEETGTTFEENAVLKAVHAARALHCLVIADDSGLVVPALKGAPGVYSARYAGNGASDIDNRRKLLREMAHLQDSQRDAYYECWIALATPEKLKLSVKGQCEGTITLQERGGQGFGYDPLFQKHEYGKTFGELDAETKNRISHRRRALDRLIPSLEAVLAQGKVVKFPS